MLPKRKLYKLKELKCGWAFTLQPNIFKVLIALFNIFSGGPKLTIDCASKILRLDTALTFMNDLF